MPKPEKRRNWSHDDDMMLLVQAAADQPFATGKGQVSKAWQALAETLMTSDAFTRVVDGKKVQYRFGLLIDEHRRFDVASAKLSGVDEEDSEKHMILDDLLARLEEVRLLAASRSTKTSQEKDKAEQGGLVVREMAMQTLKRRQEVSEEGAKIRKSGESGRTSLFAAIENEGERDRSSRDKDLEFRRLKFETEIRQRVLQPTHPQQRGVVTTALQRAKEVRAQAIGSGKALKIQAMSTFMPEYIRF
ncbi:hypothetical protein DYB32_005381 [Aphanomyces invadans]|uniref:Uncharacterized protein n=1 Tax=Aphanomyces invadans TaxID=157072 RepID=A0A3R7A8C2_9STRA|nr:hypothetical protein DYB32_005381 [Aphanomyces invadans]